MLFFFYPNNAYTYFSVLNQIIFLILALKLLRRTMYPFIF